MNKITFLITNRFGNVPDNTKDTIILTWDDWNDYSYYTLFGIEFINNIGQRTTLGGVRIAYYGQKEGSDQKTLRINDSFDKLENNYFSLGVEDTYYENLNKLGDELRDQVLTGLNDIALNVNIYEKAIKEDVTVNSLLRDISTDTVTNQYRRIAYGGARLTNYNFSYFFPKDKVKTIPSKIDFNIIAERYPPTNIQIIIGRNGVGKSHLLNKMIDSLLGSQSSDEINGSFKFNNTDRSETFSNLICVTFSAFDNFQFHNKTNLTKIKYHYVGLMNLEKIKHNTEELEGRVNIADEFTSSLGLIISSKKVLRWKSVISNLESDSIFKDENLFELIDKYDPDNLRPIQEKFGKLSSGHKVILLTSTKLVELLQEKSLVFFDEPETHLHPPLLASFIRALSDLFTSRNAVCIMTTHSPIILQEVPNSCVYKLSRKGSFAKFEKLEIESFGENVGVLTNEVFGLEIVDSGYYKVLKELVSNKENYNDAIESLHYQLGNEGRSILRSLFYNK
jgi:predicted ATPase